LGLESEISKLEEGGIKSKAGKLEDLLEPERQILISVHIDFVSKV
jgi:hypothetical protein